MYRLMYRRHFVAREFPHHALSLSPPAPTLSRTPKQTPCWMISSSSSSSSSSRSFLCVHVSRRPDSRLSDRTYSTSSVNEERERSGARCERPMEGKHLEFDDTEDSREDNRDDSREEETDFDRRHRLLLEVVDRVRHSSGAPALPEHLAERMRVILQECDPRTLTRDATSLANLLRLRTISKGHLRSSGILLGDIEFPEDHHLPPEQNEIPSRVSTQHEADRHLSSSKLSSVIEPVVYREREAAAYLAYRFPSVFSVVQRVFEEISRKRQHKFSPRTLLDFGAGPATATCAALETWSELAEILAVEPSVQMMDLGMRLLNEDRRVVWRRFLNEKQQSLYDVVVSSYVFSELVSPEVRDRTVRHLLTRTSDLLVVLEPGTPVGFEHIRRIREIGIESGFTPIAPCPHAMRCPMPSSSWCHFQQRYERTSFQRSFLGGTPLPYNDEKFSYIVLEKKSDRKPVEETIQENKDLEASQFESMSRIIRGSRKRGGHTLVDLCSPNGQLSTSVIPRSQVVYDETSGSGRYRGLVHRLVRKLHWGDEIPDVLLPSTSRRVWFSDAERSAVSTDTMDSDLLLETQDQTSGNHSSDPEHRSRGRKRRPFRSQRNSSM